MCRSVLAEDGRSRASIRVGGWGVYVPGGGEGGIPCSPARKESPADLSSLLQAGVILRTSSWFDDAFRVLFRWSTEAYLWGLAHPQEALAIWHQLSSFTGGNYASSGESRMAILSACKRLSTRRFTSSRISRTSTGGSPFGSRSGQSSRRRPGTYGHFSPHPIVMSR